MAKKIHRKKKKNKVNPEGIAFIKSTFNNTIITLADTYGNAIAWSSAGALGFKGSRKNTPFAAAQAAEKAADMLKVKATKLPSIVVIIFFIFSS